jgi:hypothetical protein
VSTQVEAPPVVIPAVEMRQRSSSASAAAFTILMIAVPPSAPAVSPAANALTLRRDRVSNPAAPSIVELATWERLQRLRDARHAWTDQTRDPPQLGAIDRATQWVSAFAKERDARAPHVSASASGEIVFEWWAARGEKTLSIYFSDGGASYLRSWGPAIENDMEDGELLTLEQARELWAWLNRGE